jgi:hypothetical protein
MPSYSSLDLPKDLKENANAVYRLDEGILTVLSPSKYNFKIHQVITLLNKEAAHHLRQNLYYDKFHKIERVTFRVFDAAGYLFKTYERKNFETKAYLDDISLYTDDKLLYLEAAAPGYPCTVEIIWEKSVSSYIELPNRIIGPPDESVESFSFTVKVPESLDIKYRELNVKLNPVIEIINNVKTYVWASKNIIALKYEEDSYELDNLPTIEIVPQVFEYDGYKGELKSWQTFGAWNYQFYEEANPFSKDVVQYIQSLVAKCKSNREKIGVLYNHLKKTMRYVSIQLGIGGVKPFPANYVDEKKYGDCKALTNYMRCVLKTVGIKSYPALINAGRNNRPADINFPADPFNHVILCVPLINDTIWLECTSNNNEAGFLGSFTENKNALLLTENGGVLVPTPKSAHDSNILSSKTVIAIDDNGGSKVSGSIFCKGDFGGLFYEMMKRDQEQRKHILINYLHYKIPEKFEIFAKGDSANGKQFNLNLFYEQQYDFKTGTKLFSSPRLASLCHEDITLSATRKHDYLFDFPYCKIDTTIYLLPAGMTVDKLPAKKEIDNEYVSYKNEYLKNEPGTIVTVIGTLSLKKSILPPSDYLQVAILFQDIKRNENEKFIIIKN